MSSIPTLWTLPAHQSLSSRLGARRAATVAPVSSTLVFLRNGPKARGGDAGSTDVPESSHKVLSVSEKEKILDLIRKKNPALGLRRSVVRTNLPSVKL